MKFDSILETLGLKEESKIEGFARFAVKHWWVWCLIAITLFSFWTRMIPSKYGELQALDPFYAYRMNLYMLDNGLQLPPHDNMRYWPDGIGIEKYGPLLYFYIPVLLYLAVSAIGFSMTYLEFAILYPALMGAFSVFIIFWLAREIFHDNKAGLFSALFLATVPAYLARTSAGFFDKEATGGTFLLLATFLFIRAYKKKSWKMSLLSSVSVFLAMGSWGGAQFVIYIIAIPLLILLVINQYKKEILIAGTLPLIVAVLTQRFFLGISTTFEQILALVVTSLIIIRFASEKYRLVKEDKLPYLIPSLLIIIFVSVLVGSMFSDFLWWIVNRGLGLIYIEEKGFIGSTVAEQMTGSWNDITARSSISYSQSMLPLGPQFETIFSIWFLMILGSIVTIYNIYSERNWMLFLPLVWMLMSIQTVFFMVRLVFFLGPPISIMAGYFLSDIINRVSRTDYMKKKEGTKKINIMTLPLIAAISLIIMSNMATGYIFCSSVRPSFNQYWSQAMDYVSNETPVNSSILSWWDFGYWFQTRGNRPSTADGGNNNGTVNTQIADWYVSDSTNWTDYRWWLKGKDVSYILMDYTLPGKYGAISKIASRGKTVTGMLELRLEQGYSQGNTTILEYKAGQYVVWLPISKDGSIAGAPIFMTKSGDQYLGKIYITDICSSSGLIKIPVEEGNNIMPGCLATTPLMGVNEANIPLYIHYIPPEAEFSIFTNLMFMDGYGIPDVEKVFDNMPIKIYKLEINETIG